jgi:hypothetical protein
VASTSVVFDILARDRASDKFDNLGRSVGRTEGKMSKFGAAAKGAAKVGVLAVAAGAVVAGKALYDMTKAAIDDEAAQVKLATALKNNANATDSQIASTESWISAQGKALGVTDDELRPALGRLVTATKDVGKAQELASLAMDVSAGSGKSLESVSTALMKAANGQVSALSRVGINTKKANGETISFEQAQRRMAATFKGAAEKNANTLSGKMQRLKVVLSEAGEEIGAKLIPVVTKMADWFLNKGLPAMEAFGDYLGKKLPPIFAYIKGVIDKFSGEGSGKLSQFISDVKGIFTDGIAIVTNLWRLFGDNILQFLKSTFDNVKMILEGAFNVIKGIFKTVSAILRGDWKEAWEGIKDILRGAKQIIVGLVRQTFNVLRFAFKNVKTALANIWRGAWDAIKDIAGKGKDWLIDKIKAIPGFIRGLAGKYKDAGSWIMSRMWEAIRNLAGRGALWLRDKIKAIPGAIKSFAGNYRDAAVQIMEKLWGVVREKAGSGVEWLMEKVRSIPGKIKELGSNFLTAGKEVIGKFFDGLGQSGGAIMDLGAKIKAAVNSALGLPRTIGFNVPGPGGDYSVTIGSFRHGTMNAPRGLALVGEDGPELVQLAGGERIYTAPQTRNMLTGGRALGGSGHDQPIVVQFVLDGKVIEQSMIRRSRETGRPLQVRTI